LLSTDEAVTLDAMPTGGASLVGRAPEAARIGREHIGGPIENLVRMAPFMKEARDPANIRLLEAFGPPRVPGWTPGFVTKNMQKDLYDIGANLTRKFQFDYSELTDFERVWAKSIFPFYTYYRKNFVLQAGELVKQPRVMASTYKTMNYISENDEELGPDMSALIPSYMDNLMAFQVPVPQSVRSVLGLPKDQPLFLNPKMPFAGLNLLPAVWNLFKDKDTFPQRAMRVLAPIFGSVGPHTMGIPGAKIALEYATGDQLGLARPIDFQRASSNDYRDSYRAAPFWTKYMPKPLQNWMGIVTTNGGQKMMTASNLYILEQVATPFISNWGNSVAPDASTESDKGKARANMVSWMTGVRLIPADMHRLFKNQSYAIKNRLESKQAELRQRGLELTPQDQHDLDLANLGVETGTSMKAVRDVRTGRSTVMGMPKFHPIRRMETIGHRISEGEKSHNQLGRDEAKYGRRAPEMRKRKRALEDLARMKKRKTTPYTPGQMQAIHRVTLAGMKNKKIMRKGPS
jgi:hypothetical protein